MSPLEKNDLSFRHAEIVLAVGTRGKNSGAWAQVLNELLRERREEAGFLE